ncbi:MAG: hypothetical protein JRH20_06020 [Deltaproteobacteria bacterium]|nr:hypothetical protein [Deltaproteobacteria bacterium]
MKHILLEIISIILFGASLVFFYQCVHFITQRDYVGALLLLLVGFAVIRAGVDLARLGFVRRK